MHLFRRSINAYNIQATSTANKLISSAKPSVWLVGGGPGSQKGKYSNLVMQGFANSWSGILNSSISPVTT